MKNSVSGCLRFIFKICQTVAGLSKISQFHEFLISFLAGFYNMTQLWHARLERQRGFPEKSLPSQSRLEISDRCTKIFGSIPTKLFCMSWTFHKTKLKRAFFRLLDQLRSLIFAVAILPSLMKKVIFSLTSKLVNSLATSQKAVGNMLPCSTNAAVLA